MIKDPKLSLWETNLASESDASEHASIWSTDIKYLS